MQKISKENSISASFVITKELIEDLCRVVSNRISNARVEVDLKQKDGTKVQLNKVEEIFKEPNAGNEEILELDINFQSGKWQSKGYKTVSLHYGGFRRGCGYSVEVMATSIKDRDFVSQISLEIEKRILEGKSKIGTFMNSSLNDHIIFPIIGVTSSVLVLYSLRGFISKDFLDGAVGFSMLMGLVSGYLSLFIFRKLYPNIVFDFSKRSQSYERLKKIRKTIWSTFVGIPLLYGFRDFLWKILTAIGHSLSLPPNK